MGDAESWDLLVASAPNATFLHARRFLDYHGSRFRDLSLVVEDDDGFAGVFPAALDPDDPAHVVSHPGATYGGLIAPGFTASETIAALEAITAHYAAVGFSRLTYKTVPHHLTAVPTQADRYALWRLGATMTRRDLWSVVWADEPAIVSPRLKPDLAVAARHDLEIFEDTSDIAYRRYHRLLCDNLEDRHGVKPVHTVEEMMELRHRLTDGVALVLVAPKGQRDAPIAGTWLFRFGRIAWHTQYIAADAAGRKKQATHLLLHHLLEEVRARGVAALSYGAVTEYEGRVLNPGLERFKAKFGGGLVIHDFFTLSLERA
jgi:hypothetical protein